MVDNFWLTRPLCGSCIAQSSHRYMRPVCFHNCTKYSYVDYGLITIRMLISILSFHSPIFSNEASCISPLWFPPSDLPSCSHNHTDTHLHPSPMVIPMQCCAMLCCCVCVTWPLPFHAIVQQTDAVPPSTLIIPVIPISTVPAEPAVISSSTSQVFFFLYFPSTPPPSFIFLLSSCWSFFLIPAIPLLVDGPEGLSAPESGKVPWLPLTNSICVSTSRRKWKAPQKDRQRDWASEREWI